MNRDKLAKLIDKFLIDNEDGYYCEQFADYLISNGIGDITAEKHRADVAEEALGKVQATALSILHANSYDVDVLLKRAIKAGVKVDDLLCSPKCNRAKQYEDDLQKAEARLAELKEVQNERNIIQGSRLFKKSVGNI